MKRKLVTKRKAPVKALATRRPANSKWNYTPAEARLHSYEQTRGTPGPQLDPDTRHTLVTLAESVQEFRNLEDRISQLAGQVTEIENEAANTPDAWWRSMQQTLSLLQKEFRDRVTALERQAGNIEMVVSRMDRLERRMDELTGSKEQ